MTKLTDLQLKLFEMDLARFKSVRETFGESEPDPVYKQIINTKSALDKFKKERSIDYVNTWVLSYEAGFIADIASEIVDKHQNMHSYSAERGMIHLARLSNDFLFASLRDLIAERYEMAFTLLRNAIELVRAITWISGERSRYQEWEINKRERDGKRPDGKSTDKFETKDPWQDAAQRIYKMSCKLGTHAFDTSAQVDALTRLEQFDWKETEETIDAALQKLINSREENNNIEGDFPKTMKERLMWFDQTGILTEDLFVEGEGFNFIGFWYFGFYILTFLSFQYFVESNPDNVELRDAWQSLAFRAQTIPALIRFKRDYRKLLQEHVLSIYGSLV